MVEHPAVNRRVVGSSPTRGAYPVQVYFYWIVHSRYHSLQFYNPKHILLYQNSLGQGFTARYRSSKSVFVKEIPSSILLSAQNAKYYIMGPPCDIKRFINAENILHASAVILTKSDCRFGPPDLDGFWEITIVVRDKRV